MHHGFGRRPRWRGGLRARAPRIDATRLVWPLGWFRSTTDRVTNEFCGAAPEINSARLFSGAGSGPVLAAATTWTGLAAELRSAAAAFLAVASGLTGNSWRGPAAAVMSDVAASYVGWLSASGAHAEQAAEQAKTAAQVFEAARAVTVQPGLVAATVLSSCRWLAPTCSGKTPWPSQPLKLSMSRCGPRTWWRCLITMPGPRRLPPR